MYEADEKITVCPLGQFVSQAGQKHLILDF
jgi:hypothetical protein